MNSTYFEDPTDKLQYNGKEVGVIKKGDSQTTVNEKLAEEIESLKQKLSSKEPLIGASTASVKNDSVFGFDKSLVDSGERLLVNVEPKEDSIYVSYNFNISEGAEKVFSNVSVEGMKSGIQNVIMESNKLSNGFYLSPDNFPASINFNLDQNRNGTIERLTTRVQLQPTGDNTSYVLYKRNLNKSDLQTQKDVNEFLFREVNRVSKSTEEKKVMYKGSQKDIFEVVVDMANEIAQLKKSISDMTKE